MPRANQRRNHGLAIRYAHRAFVRCLWGILAEEKLTSTQFLILRTLWDENGLTQSELARRLAMDNPHVTSTIDRMARRGLVLRRTNREDRRCINVMLTARARVMKDRMVPKLNPANEIAAAGVSRRDIGTLHRVLRRMTDNLEAHLRAAQARDPVGKRVGARANAASHPHTRTNVPAGGSFKARGK